MAADREHNLEDKIIQMCHEDAEAKKVSKGSIVCPSCGGTVEYEVSSYNSHMSGRCVTAGCIEWWE